MGRGTPRGERPRDVVEAVSGGNTVWMNRTANDLPEGGNAKQQEL